VIFQWFGMFASARDEILLRKWSGTVVLKLS